MVAALVILLVPVLMVVGNYPDPELVRTGQPTVGVITRFNNESLAPQRKMKVNFQSDDASVQSTGATMDS